MKILYGVQATGNGHISRSREVITSLKRLGHEVHVILSGRDSSLLWDMDEFEPFTVLKGLTFNTSRGRVNHVKTALGLNLFRFYRDILSCDPSGIDLAVTDFEPVTSRIARRNRIPCIGIGHQYAFYYDIPVTGSNPVARFILKNYAPADYPVGLHWHHFGKPILPPIVPYEVPSGQEVITDKILVYLPFEEVEDIEALLKPFSTHKFYIYCPVERSGNADHLHWRSYSRTGFLNDLAECGGVICNAGFELASEALSLGKKILVKPLAGQMEQMSNALAFSVLRLGKVMHELDKDMVADFLKTAPGVPMRYPNVARMLAEWIEKGRWHDIGKLADKCWKSVEGGPLR